MVIVEVRASRQRKIRAAWGRQVGGSTVREMEQTSRRKVWETAPERFDVGAVGQIGVGHDRGRVGIHQHDPITLFLQGTNRLGAGVVELTCLTDDDWA